MSFERMVEDVQKAEKAAEKYEGALTKAGKAVSGFMSAQTGFKGWAKSFLYNFKGTFTIMNKLKTNLIATGKIWDNTIGAMANKNSFLGKSIGKLSKLKIPNFAEKLGGSARKAVTKGQETVAQLQSGGISGMMKKGKDIRAKMSSRRAAVKARRSTKVSRKISGAKTVGGHKGGEGGFASLFEGFDKQTKGISQTLKEGSMKWLRKSKGLVIGVLKLSRTILSKAFNFFIISMLVIMAIGAFIKIFWNTVQSLYTGFIEPFEGFFESISTAIDTVWESFSTIFDFFMGDASLLDLAFAMLDLLVAGAYILLKFGYTVLMGGLSALAQLAEDAWDAAIDWFKGLSWKQWALLAVGALTAMVLWMYGLPIILPAIIIGGIFVIAYWLWDRLSNWDVFHAGGTSHGGMALVGEKGPELVNLPAGSKVHSNKKSRSMVGGGGGVTNINITINARDTSDGEMRRIASKIGDMVNSKINRTTSSRTMG
mgnify:CR=1 FL=1